MPLRASSMASCGLCTRATVRRRASCTASFTTAPAACLGAAHLPRAGRDRRALDSAMVDATLQRHRDWQASFGGTGVRVVLMGDIALLLLAYDLAPTEALADRIEELIRGNMRHPARELMWGAPGTMLVALFLARHTHDERWSELFLRDGPCTGERARVVDGARLPFLDTGPLWPTQHFHRCGPRLRRHCRGGRSRTRSAARG
jgi:hypothetical protein